MSPASTKGKRRTGSRAKSKGGWLRWWPVALGIAVTPVAVHFASIFALEGPAALRLLYPYVLLLKDPALGLSSDMSDGLSQGMMYAQFPIYGLLMMLTMRSRSVAAGFGSAVVMHVLGVFVLFLMAHMQVPK